MLLKHSTGVVATPAGIQRVGGRSLYLKATYFLVQWHTGSHGRGGTQNTLICGRRRLSLMRDARGRRPASLCAALPRISSTHAELRAATPGARAPSRVARPRRPSRPRQRLPPKSQHTLSRQASGGRRVRVLQQYPHPIPESATPIVLWQ
jgi:hypothetical protein